MFVLYTESKMEQEYHMKISKISVGKKVTDTADATVVCYLLPPLVITIFIILYYP